MILGGPQARFEESSAVATRFYHDGSGLSIVTLTVHFDTSSTSVIIPSRLHTGFAFLSLELDGPTFEDSIYNFFLFRYDYALIVTD